MSSIEWTGKTWNPVVGCTRVSDGCDHCYAAVMSNRLGAMAEADERAGKNPGRKKHYKGLTVLNKKGDRHFNGTVRTVPEALDEPLKVKKPTLWFVNSMSDLFHESVPFEFVDRVFAVMALCPQHTFQILTKRPERMAEYLSDGDDDERDCKIADVVGMPFGMPGPWPLPNVWLGTSAENQSTLDARVPHLLRCPAAVRFLSLEPLLGAIDLHSALRPQACNRCQSTWYGRDTKCPGCYDDPCAMATHGIDEGVDWVIVGGESGPKARGCDIGWIREIVRQCKGAGVPVFVKQLGSKPVCGCGGDVGAWARSHGFKQAECAKCGMWLPLKNGKGGDMSEWPADLRVREMPVKGKVMA